MKTSRNTFFTLWIVLSIFMTLELQAQTSIQRVTLVEQVTSASCVPCANQNPAFNILLGQNEGNRVVAIKYQRGGGPYLDDMWDFNPAETDHRIANYYNTTSFPQVWIDGVYTGSPVSVSQTDLDNAKTQPAWFEIEVTKQLNATNDSLFITGTVTYLNDFFEPIDNHLRAFFVVIEEEVNYLQANPPGTNGELDFKWVMRKMLPAYNGHTMGQDSVGTQHSFSYIYPIDQTKIDAQQLEVVAFVQRYGTKEIMQAVKTADVQQPTATTTPVRKEKLLIYPTIATDEISVTLGEEWQKNTEVRIYNTQGKMLKFKTAHSEGSFWNLTFNTTKLPVGTYLVIASDEEKRAYSKFVKTN